LQKPFDKHLPKENSSENSSSIENKVISLRNNPDHLPWEPFGKSRAIFLTTEKNMTFHALKKGGWSWVPPYTINQGGLDVCLFVAWPINKHSPVNENDFHSEETGKEEEETEDTNNNNNVNKTKKRKQKGFQQKNSEKFSKTCE
jgi:hypothetical protein